MGYCMQQHDACFTIKREKQDDCLKAIKALGDNVPKYGYSWVDTSKFMKANDLAAALDAWRWTAEVDDETGDVTAINFRGEKLGDDHVLWNAIAPFVEPDCYIQMGGEDGSAWRWTFNGKTCEEVQPRW